MYERTVEGRNDRVSVLVGHIREARARRPDRYAYLDVFLAESRVYKLKRAAKFPYLDYSTPELRRTFCEEEVRTNRRTAPQLYLEVAAIARMDEGSLALGGDGKAVDWVVAMRRFEQAAQRDSLA